MRAAFAECGVSDCQVVASLYAGGTVESFRLAPRRAPGCDDDGKDVVSRRQAAPLLVMLSLLRRVVPTDQLVDGCGGQVLGCGSQRPAGLGHAARALGFG